MNSRSILTALAVLGLTGCVDTSSTDYPALNVLSPENVPVSSAPVATTPSEADRYYTAVWTCVWDTMPTQWELPGIQLEAGRAYAVNEWTRLDGKVTDTPEEGRVVSLSGERLSNDGHWYPMAMEGRIFPDRPSTLFGYWKGATCEAKVDPVDLQNDQAA